MKKLTNLIYESAKIEDIRVDCKIDDDSDDIIDDEDIDDIEDLDEQLFYTAEMIPVIEAIQYNGTRYCCLEAENLFKYMNSNNLEIGDLEKAIEDIANACGLAVNDLALVTESASSLKMMISEAKKSTSASKLVKDKLDWISNITKEAKHKGIKVLKRK